MTEIWRRFKEETTRCRIIMIEEETRTWCWVAEKEGGKGSHFKRKIRRRDKTSWERKEETKGQRALTS